MHVCMPSWQTIGAFVVQVFNRTRALCFPTISESAYKVSQNLANVLSTFPPCPRESYENHTRIIRESYENHR